MDKSAEGLYEEAFGLLKNAAQYNTINPEIYYNNAYNHYQLRHYSETVENINKALEYDKEGIYHTKYLLLVADAYHQLGSFFEEKKALSDLLRIDDTNPEGLYRSGMMYAAQHNIKNAEEAFKKSI